MQVVVSCPSCGLRKRVDASALGRQARCGCGRVFTLEAQQVGVSAESSPPGRSQRSSKARLVEQLPKMQTAESNAVLPVADTEHQPTVESPAKNQTIREGLSTIVPKQPTFARFEAEAETRRSRQARNLPAVLVAVGGLLMLFSLNYALSLGTPFTYPGRQLAAIIGLNVVGVLLFHARFGYTLKELFNPEILWLGSQPTFDLAEAMHELDQPAGLTLAEVCDWLGPPSGVFNGGR